MEKIEKPDFILKDNELFKDRILERIKELEIKQREFQAENRDFLNITSWYMYGATIDELYLLLTSYDNAMILKERKEKKQCKI